MSKKSESEGSVPNKKRKLLKRSLGPLSIVSLTTLIFYFSSLLVNQTLLDPPNVLGVTPLHLLLMFLDVLLFILINLLFGNVIFIGQRNKFGTNKLFSVRTLILFTLQILFVGLVFILLDVALVNIFFLQGSTTLVWALGLMGNTNDPTYLLGFRHMYSEIRSLFFLNLFVMLVLFPFILSLILLTRYAKKNFQEIKPTNPFIFQSSLWVKLIKLLSVLLFLFVFYGNWLYFTTTQFNLDNIFLLLLTNVVVIIVGLIFIIVFVYITSFFTNLISWFIKFGGANLLLVLPFVSLFYLLPVFLWTTWDIYSILLLSTTQRTAFDPQTVTFFTGNRNYSISDLSFNSVSNIMFIIGTLLQINFLSPLRILQLDFIFIIGLSAAMLGFVEGFSIFSLVQLFLRGGFKSALKSSSAKKRSFWGGVTTAFSRLYPFILIGSWFSLLIDRFIILYISIQEQIPISLPNLGLRSSFQFIIDLLTFTFIQSEIYTSVILIAIPLYIIFGASIKFFSISIVIERIKEDLVLFLLLISSAFLLIVVKIYGDISSLDQFIGKQHNFLPLAFLSSTRALLFILKIFQVLESISFYIGVIVALIAFILYPFKGWIILKPLTSSQEEETKSDNRESS